MIISLWIIVILTVLGALGAIASVGKEREPITPGAAMLSVVYAAFVATILINLTFRI